MSLVHYRLTSAAAHPGATRDPVPVAHVVMDDGKVNVMSLAMLGELADAFDRAEADGAMVVLRGRDGVFSAGYDMAMFAADIETIFATLIAGGDLVRRILTFPFPVLVACNGHAIAQGAFILLSADLRIGIDTEWKTGLNEVAIGLTIPHYAIAVSEMRLTPPAFQRAATTGPLWTASEGLPAGFVDELVSADDFDARVAEETARLAVLDMTAHAATKLRAREATIATIDERHHAEFGG